MEFKVDNPLWMLAFIPVVIVLILYLKSITVLTGARKVLIVIIRGIIFSLLILALAGVQLLWPIQQISTIFVVDRSHSMEEEEQTVLHTIQQAINEKAPDNKVGVVSTGLNASVEIPLAQKNGGITAFQTKVNRSYTNLANGLQVAGSLLSSNDKGRIILLTDGNQNIGDAVKQASYLNKQGYVVDVMPLDPGYKEDVAIDAFDIPETVYLGEQAAMTLTIRSSVNTTSQIRIEQDGEMIVEDVVDIREGINTVAYQQIITEGGFHTFRAEIVSTADQVIENNELSAFSETRGLPRVLVVEGENNATVNLKQALEASLVRVETVTPELLPTQLSGYLNYDSIVLGNVSAHMLTQHQMNLMEKAVRDFGVGFVMTGGDQSFGVGGYFKTPIEQLMPVHMDIKGKQELPSLGLVIVLDKSGSMSGSKIALAREAAARSIDLLREKDTLGVIAFDSTPWQIVDTGPITNKEDVMDNIRSITASGGTDIFTPTEQAYRQLDPLKLQRKHIILLTDGQSATTSNYRQVIEAGKESGISLSTVAIGMEADGPLLEEMATIGGGRFYQVQNDSTIPTILSRETALITRTYIEDNPFHPRIANGYEWTPHLNKGVPQMNAYIATTPKGRAQNILLSEKSDPVLSRWQYGLGKTVAWTSDLTGEWAGDWPSWKKWSPLWNDIVTWTFPQYETKNYQVNKEIVGDQVTLHLSKVDTNSSVLHTSLISESGEEIDLELQPTAPGEYKGTFKAQQSGVYYLQLSELENKEVVGIFKTGIVVPYSQEYVFSAKNELLSQQIAESGGGEVIENMNNAFSSQGLSPKYKKQDLFYLLLVAVLFLFLTDVAMRRFRFKIILSHKWNIFVKWKKPGNTQHYAERTNQIKHLTKTMNRHKHQEKIAPTKNKEQAEQKHNGSHPSHTVNDYNQKTKTVSREDRIERLLSAKNKKSK